MSEQPHSMDPARRITLTGGAPVEVPSGAVLWRATGGAVDLLLEHESGRAYLLRAEDGTSLFGSDGTEGSRFLVSGVDGAVLEEIAITELSSDELADAADHWINALSKVFVNRPPPGTAEQGQLFLADGDRGTPVAGTVLSASKNPLWAMIPAAGAVRLADSDTVIQGPAAIPFAGPLWLEVVDPATVWCQSSRSIGSPDTLLNEIMAFNGLLPSLLQDLAARGSQAALDRLHAEQLATERRVETSLDTLTRTTVTPRARLLPSSATLGSVGAALAMVFDSLGIAWQAKQLSSPMAALADVPSLARQAAVRTRRVLLRPGWQDQDLGPLISARGESQAVVALIPAGRRGYQLFDPESGHSQELTDEQAREIGPTAYSLYRPFREEPLQVWDLVRFVWSDIRRDGITAALAGAAVGLLATLVPIMTAVIIDTVIPSNETLLLVQLGIALGLAALLSFCFTLVREVALHRINGRTESALQAALWDRLLRLPAGFFRGYSAGDLAQRVGGIEAVRDAIVDVALGATLTFVFSSFNIVLLFIYSPPLAGIALALVLFLAAVTFAVGLLQIRHNRKVAAVEGELSGSVFQYLQGVTKLRVAGAESRAFSRWADRYAEERLARIKAGLIRNHYEAFSATYQGLSLAILYGATAWLAADKLSAGFFIAFLAAFGAFQSAFMEFARSALSVFAVMPQYERGKPVLQATLENDSSKADPGRLKGEIKVSALAFGYGDDGPRIFDGLELSVEAGQAVAVVGPSGSGKSTLLRLLLGFERPRNGAILYDGQDLQSLDLSLLRRQIGVVLQTGRVFAGSILENIRGSADLSIDQCLEAAHAAGLESDLAQMPMGLHTPLTEGASTLSGGQRQRILIARALASRPKLLFLDEATSALDNRTQAVVTDTLDQLGVTRIIVAHRLSTVRNADRIYYIDGGRVLEQGSFDDLMALDGRFAALATRQLL